MRITALVLLGIAIARFAYAIVINLSNGANIFIAFGGILGMAVFAGEIIAFVYILKTKRMVKND